MQRVFALSMLVSLALICACQKKHSAAEQQLAQPKSELDAREQELAEKLDSLDKNMDLLDQRMKELAQKEEAAMNARTNPNHVHGQPADPVQLQAEKEMIKQQLSTMIPKPSQVDAAEKQRLLKAAGMSPGHQ